jgi:hypothetical protein
MLKKTPDWPDFDFNAYDRVEASSYYNICKAIRLHAAIMEECADKICKALWAGVKKDKAVSGD